MLTAFRQLLIVAIIVVGVIALGVCGDSLTTDCEHLCCRGAQRPCPASRIARWLSVLMGVASGVVAVWSHGTFTALRTAEHPSGSVPLLCKIAVLRV